MLIMILAHIVQIPLDEMGLNNGERFSVVDGGVQGRQPVRCVRTSEGDCAKLAVLRVEHGGSKCISNQNRCFRVKITVHLIPSGRSTFSSITIIIKYVCINPHRNHTTSRKGKSL